TCPVLEERAPGQDRLDAALPHRMTLLGRDIPLPGPEVEPVRFWPGDTRCRGRPHRRVQGVRRRPRTLRGELRQDRCGGEHERRCATGPVARAMDTAGITMHETSHK